jgi:hypothetical protein
VTILITVAPMVPVLAVLIGVGIWCSRGEFVARPEPMSGASRNLTRVVPIAPTRTDDVGPILDELCRLARRESSMITAELRAAAGERTPLTEGEQFILRVTAARVDVLRAHRPLPARSDEILTDVEDLLDLRRRLEQLETLDAEARSQTVA